MKHILHPIFLILILIMTGCASNEEEDVSKDEAVTSEDIGEAEAGSDAESENGEDQESDEVLDKSVGSIEDFEYVSIDEYAGEGERIETDEMMEKSIFLDEDHYFVHTDNHEVISYTKDMKENWKIELPYSIDKEMVLTEDYLLVNVVTFQGDEGYIEALDRDTGESVYQIDLTDYNGLSAILVVDEMIYFFAGESTDPDEEIYSDTFTFHKYDVNDGSLEWEQDLDNTDYSIYFDRIPYADETIYILDNDQNLLALDMDTGEEVWKQEIPLRFGLPTPYIADDKIYLFDLDNIFHSYDPKTGEEISEYAYPGYVETAFVKPVFNDSTLIYHDLQLTPDEDEIEGFQLIATDLEKDEVLWSLDFGENYIFSTQIIDDMLYVLAAHIDDELDKPSKVLKLHPETGEMLAAIELDERMDHGISSNYIHSGVGVTNETLSFFYEYVAYYVK